MYDYDYRIRGAAKQKKHPAAVASLLDYLKTGPYKPYFRVKSSRGDKIVLIPHDLNSLVNRVEVTGLSGEKGKYEIFLENGSSGWGWDVFRKPPQFHNDPGYNEIRWALLERSDVEMQLKGLLATLVKAIQRSGFVQDPIAKRVVPLDVWEASEKGRAEAAEKAKAEAEARQKAREKEEKERAERVEQLKKENWQWDSSAGKLVRVDGPAPAKQEESSQAWSVVMVGRNHSYATQVNVYHDKAKAEAEAKDSGNCYVVKGTQMWNEPLGQVEEHDRAAPYKFFPGDFDRRDDDDDESDD